MGIELCGSSSCLGGFRSLLNTEGILTLPMFLLSDGSLIWMWSASFAWWCRELLSLSIIMKSLSCAFGCFVEMWWFLMAPVVWFLWSFRSLKDRVSHHRNQTMSAIRNHHISTKHPKAQLKDFIIIDRDNSSLHHQAKEALHIHIKDPSLNRNIGKVRIPSVFNKLLKPPRQLELPHSSIPNPRGHLLYLVFQHKRQWTLHTILISIYNRSVIPMFTPFKLQDNWTLRSPPSKKHIVKHFSHIRKCHLIQNVFKLLVLWSCHQFIKQGWRRN